jgi:hypothetical protein
MCRAIHVIIGQGVRTWVIAEQHCWIMSRPCASGLLPSGRTGDGSRDSIYRRCSTANRARISAPMGVARVLLSNSLLRLLTQFARLSRVLRCRLACLLTLGSALLNFLLSGLHPRAAVRGLPGQPGTAHGGLPFFVRLRGPLLAHQPHAPRGPADSVALRLAHPLPPPWHCCSAFTASPRRLSAVSEART